MTKKTAGRRVRRRRAVSATRSATDGAPERRRPRQPGHRRRRRPRCRPRCRRSAQLLDRYCVGCHSQRAKAAGQDSARTLTLDDLDPARVSEHPDKWELVVRKLRAGMMPPANSRRPDKVTYDGFITWLENELDRTPRYYAPPPGLHRLNRTEYANAIRDVLDLAIDPGAYLPSDDSTHGFDNIAGALGISSTLIEAYMNAAGKISRLAIGEPTTARSRRLPNARRHVAGLPRRRAALRHARRHPPEARVPLRRRVHDHGDADLRRQHVADRVRIRTVREARNPSRRRASGARRLAGQPSCSARRRRTAAARARRPAARTRGAAGGRGAAAARHRPVDSRALKRSSAAAAARRCAPASRRRRARTGSARHSRRPTSRRCSISISTSCATRCRPGRRRDSPFFPHVGTVRIEGPFNAVPAKESPSRARIFVCRPAGLPPIGSQACRARDDRPPIDEPRDARIQARRLPPAMSRR